MLTMEFVTLTADKFSQSLRTFRFSKLLKRNRTKIDLRELLKGWGHNQDIIHSQIKSIDFKKNENLAVRIFPQSTHIKILLRDTLQVEVWADMTNLGKGRKDEDSFC